ncbi:3076_t:CDS:2, partial [Racocetra persica]
DIEGELGFERKKDTEDGPAIECEKDTEDRPSIEPEDGPGIELEEDIDIISKSDNISKNTDNYQHGHLSPICIKIYCEKTFGTWKEYQETLECYAPVIYDSVLGTVNGLSKGPDNETIIKLTSMHPEHNHQLIPKNASFATSYRKLTTDMKELIKSYTICDIDHIGRNIKKQLAKLLGDRYADFIKNQLNIYLDSLIHVKQTGQKHLQTVNERTQLYVLFNRIESHIAEEQFAKVVDNGPIEFEYDFCQIQFDELLEEVDYSLVAEVWDVQSIEHNSHVRQNVVLLKNRFHLCTCILLFDSGVVCCYWFCVLLQSEKAYFHISLIPR